MRMRKELPNNRSVIGESVKMLKGGERYDECG
jgi:hypothetical protein